MFLEAGDLLAPTASSRSRTSLGSDPLLDLVYWDDDRSTIQGSAHRIRSSARRGRPRRSSAPTTSGRSFAIRHRRLAACGGIVAPASGTRASWDLLLRADLDGPASGRRAAGAQPPRPRPTPNAERVQCATVVEDRPRQRDDGSRDGHVRAGHGADHAGTAADLAARHRGRSRRGTTDRWSACLAELRAPPTTRSLDVVVVDNGERTDDNEQWYARHVPAASISRWSGGPSSRSTTRRSTTPAPRSRAARCWCSSTTTPRCPIPGGCGRWSSWAVRPDIGWSARSSSGPTARSSTAASILGINGFADHLFQGMRPDSPSLLGPTSWYRNVLAVTGACVAVRREPVRASSAGFDERFVLCGSDVALGLDAVDRGQAQRRARRSRACATSSRRHAARTCPPKTSSPATGATSAGCSAGDPYFSPNLSLSSPRAARCARGSS